MEGCVSHEDDTLVTGGTVSGHCHYLFRHLIHVDLGRVCVCMCVCVLGEEGEG